jgi:DNA (cytosine-5)-methyltransferase 1
LDTRPVVLDLFCGAGGMSLGFQMAGYRIALGVEMNKLAATTYQANFGPHCYVGNIRDIADPQSFIQQYGLTHVDVIIGGPPCQGFARVGRGKLRRLKNDPNYDHDPRNDLYREFLRFVAALRPIYFVLENVPEMGRYSDGSDLLIETAKRLIRGALKYEEVDVQTLRADEYGVPQTRRRLFMAGNRVGEAVRWPEPAYRGRPVSVWAAISDLPIVPMNHRQNVIFYTERREMTDYQREMREEAGDLLFNHQTRWHRPDDIEAFMLLEEGGRYVELPDRLRRYDSKKHPELRNDQFKDRYRKLIRDEPAWTIEAHIGKDSYRFIYPSRQSEPEPPRTISVREAARLQSFPDRFRFYGPFTRQFEQVGNAVPPILAREVALAIKPTVLAGMAKRELEIAGDDGH